MSRLRNTPLTEIVRAALSLIIVGAIHAGDDNLAPLSALREDWLRN
jgi:hypothetical protein